jgi:hypothetical protein
MLSLFMQGEKRTGSQETAQAAYCRQERRGGRRRERGAGRGRRTGWTHWPRAGRAGAGCALAARHAAGHEPRAGCAPRRRPPGLRAEPRGEREVGACPGAEDGTHSRGCFRERGDGRGCTTRNSTGHGCSEHNEARISRGRARLRAREKRRGRRDHGQGPTTQHAKGRERPREGGEHAKGRERPREGGETHLRLATAETSCLPCTIWI